MSFLPMYQDVVVGGPMCLLVLASFDCSIPEDVACDWMGT
jgi:hypothetical protein